MDTKKLVSDQDIEFYLNKLGFRDYEVDEGRLKLMELILKAAAGYYNSHTEEGFLNSFGLMRKDRKPNRRGSRFVMSMIYASSNRRPLAFDSMMKYRRQP